jgi:phosphoenolpyruvate-protein phosphotransferase (PTS system enzyme I)
MTNAPLRLTGTPASPGFARGPMHVLDDAVRTSAAGRAEPRREDERLRGALATASAELGDLIARSADADAEPIIEFQVAMLEDDALTGPAFAAIAGGAVAEDAWRSALDAHVREYESAGDPYFRGRAADLRDMRDRVLRCLAGASAATVPAGAIVIAADLAPSRFLEISWTGGGIALFDGSTTSHLATLARARGVPMIVGMSHAELPAHGDALLDAERGVLIASPDRHTAATFEAQRDAAAVRRAGDAMYLERPATTANGVRVRVLLNVADLAELGGIAPAWCDGIGLVRTELMFRTMADLAGEERQFERYREIVGWAEGRPVTFRTLDAGGDKPIEGYTVAGESNPFLGLRGVRLSLLHPEILATQLRALARAAVYGDVRVMIPMVTRPSELDEVRSLLDETVGRLREAGTACARPALGMMVEVPAAAIAIDTFDAEFLSIGSNDLIQYLCACSRESDRLAALQDPLQPAVLRLIRGVVSHASEHGIELSLCGDAASDVRYLPHLLKTGLRCFSVAPAQLGAVKAAIARANGEAGG